eukprot:354670-Chlamydomonas_euryale.AAC.8
MASLANIDSLARDPSSGSGTCLAQQAWQDAIKNRAALEFKEPRQAGRMTRSCACRGESG